jgi:hypothetical protein
MLLHSWLMVKVFLVATVTGMIVTNILEYTGYLKRVSKGSSLGLPIFWGYDGNVIGGLMLGSGMALSGSCPGTVFAQFGTGIPTAKYVLLGGITAAFLIALMHKIFNRTTHGRFLEKCDTPTIDRALSVPMLYVTIAALLIVGLAVGLLERVFPFSSEFTSTLQIAKISPIKGVLEAMRAIAWPPVFAGVFIGLLQIPSILLLNQFMGTSSCYVSAASLITRMFTKGVTLTFPYFTDFVTPQSFGQVGYALGIMLGSYLSVAYSKFVPPSDSFNVSPATSYFGGMFLIMGARLAGGCTSGHGISGMARLGVSSIVTVGCMFAGGIATARIMLSCV